VDLEADHGLEHLERLVVVHQIGFGHVLHRICLTGGRIPDAVAGWAAVIESSTGSVVSTYPETTSSI
jgi:hypothetical protein